jgi:iron-sulfur cluster repair protein YtfE (RIC family)
MDMVTQLLAMKQAGTQQLMQLAVMRKAHQRDQQLLDLIDEVTSKAPTPSGAGRVVDKQA